MLSFFKTFLCFLFSRRGTDLYTVKELLGHCNITMTERYSHLGQNTLQGAVKNLEKTMSRARKEAEQRKEQSL